MTTVPSKRYRKQSSTDLVAALAYVLAIGALLFLGARASAFYPAPGQMPGIQGGMNGVLAGSEASLAADAQYWDVNCSHGWSSDSTCDTIVVRTQSCEISAASTYCSEYKTYLRQFLDR